MCEFKIQELSLFNYRRFENKKFILNPRMNVFAGKNGSGKTAVLEAVNVMLGAYLAAYKTYVPSRLQYKINGCAAESPDFGGQYYFNGWNYLTVPMQNQL